MDVLVVLDCLLGSSRSKRMIDVSNKTETCHEKQVQHAYHPFVFIRIIYTHKDFTPY